MGMFRYKRPDGKDAKARVTYHAGGRELGQQRPDKGVRTNVKMDLVITSGPRAGTESYYKGHLSGDLAWLIAEGDEIPVIVDPEGKVVGIDEEALAPMLTEEKDSLDAAHKEQSSLHYAADLPTRDELGHVKELPGEARKVFGRLFKRGKDSEKQ